MMLFNKVNPSYKSEIKQVLKQSLLEYWLLCFVKMKFFHLKQLFVDALLSNFLTI